MKIKDIRVYIEADACYFEPDYRCKGGVNHNRIYTRSSWSRYRLVAVNNKRERWNLVYFGDKGPELVEGDLGIEAGVKKLKQAVFQEVINV